MRAKSVVAALAVVAVAGCSQPADGSVPLGDASARSANASAPLAPGAIEPGQLYVPRIAVNAKIHPRASEMRANPFAGGKVMSSFGVPPDRSSLAWWSDGPQVGSDGLAIILGHAQTGEGSAVFDHLDEVKPGDVITVENPDGSERVIFQVVSGVRGIPKRDPAALTEVLTKAPPQARLALITCGGDADFDAGATDENVVVFAKRAG